MEGKEVHSWVYRANGNLSVGETGAPLFSVGCGESGISHCEHAGSWLGGAILKAGSSLQHSDQVFSSMGSPPQGSSQP